MTENEKNLALGLAKVKVESLIDYYSKGNTQLQHFDKEGLLGKIASDLLELRGILDGCKYNPFDEQAKVMDEADKRKEVLQNERELNPDTFTKEVSAYNLEKISQRAEYNANDYIGHPFDEGEDGSITYARESYEAGFKQGWQEGETYGFDKGFDFCEQTNDIQHIKEIKCIDKIDASDELKKAALLHSERYRMHWPNQVRPAYDAFIAGAKWHEEYWDKVMRDNHVEMI